MENVKKELEDYNWLKDHYENQQLSFKEIADILNTYPNKIRRAITKANQWAENNSMPQIQVKNRSDAQRLALQMGRHKHPTRGQKRTEAERNLISDGVSESWEKLTDEQRQKRSLQSKEAWEKLTPEQKESMRSKAAQAIRESATSGSKLENYIADQLRKDNVLIDFHKKGAIPNTNLEIDIFLPSRNIAIEIDGPSHFEPIWGEEAFHRTQKSDAEKNGQLMYWGVIVIRVKQKKRTLSQKDMRNTWMMVKEKLDEIRDNPPENKFIELEIK